MNIIVKTTGEDAYSLNGKIEITNNTLADIIIDIILNSSYTNFYDLPISMPSRSHTETRIGYVVMFPTYSGMYQDHHINT